MKDKRSHPGEENGSAKLTANKVFFIRQLWSSFGRSKNQKGSILLTTSAVARAFKLPRQTVSDIVRGRTWTK